MLYLLYFIIKNVDQMLFIYIKVIIFINYYIINVVIAIIVIVIMMDYSFI